MLLHRRQLLDLLHHAPVLRALAWKDEARRQGRRQILDGRGQIPEADWPGELAAQAELRLLELVVMVWLAALQQDLLELFQIGWLVHALSDVPWRLVGMVPGLWVCGTQLNELVQHRERRP